MKLRHLIPLFLAVAGLFMACSEENEPTYLDQVRVSSSYVSIPVEGGATSITVTAAADWQLAKIFAKTIINATGEKETVYESVPQWLTVSQTAGPAGETMLTFEADAAIDGRTAELRLNCAGQTQIINVIQGLSTVSNATCAEVIAGPDSKTYRVTGTVTSIANTTYGNWYLNDGTGEIYIYGTLDAKGQTKNFLSLGLEVGDEVTVEGPKTTYNGTVELVDVTVVKINKSLIKVDSLTVDGVKTEAPMPVEGGLITANLTCKGNGVSVDIPEDAKNWLSIASIDGSSPTVTFRVAANNGGDRSTNIVFKTFDGKKEYSCKQALSQKGAIVAATVKEFLAAPVGDTQYRLTGVITKVARAEYGNVYIADYSGEAYVYGIGAKGDFEKLGLKEGDIVTLVGKRGEYKGDAQMTGGQYESHISVTEISIADFLTKEDDKNVYYKVTGTLDEIADEANGNVYLKDGDQRLYVYGCYPGWGATGDFRKNCLADKGIEVGDKLTVIGVKSTYNGTPQVSNGVYFSHEKGN